MAIHSAKGTFLYFDPTGALMPPTVHIGQVRSITGPTIKPKIVDVTTHDTPGFWAQKLAVLIEGGDISFELNWNIADPTHDFAPAVTTSMWYAMVGSGNVSDGTGLARASLSMKFPYSAGTMNFYGYVAQHEFTAPVDNVLACKIQFAITDNIMTSVP
jgi:hypothetical protein